MSKVKARKSEIVPVYSLTYPLTHVHKDHAVHPVILSDRGKYMVLWEPRGGTFRVSLEG